MDWVSEDGKWAIWLIAQGIEKFAWANCETKIPVIIRIFRE